jgi:hypothetical protein
MAWSQPAVVRVRIRVNTRGYFANVASITLCRRAFCGVERASAAAKRAANLSFCSLSAATVEAAAALACCCRMAFSSANADRCTCIASAISASLLAAAVGVGDGWPTSFPDSEVAAAPLFAVTTVASPTHTNAVKNEKDTHSFAEQVAGRHPYRPLPNLWYRPVHTPRPPPRTEAYEAC